MSLNLLSRARTQTFILESSSLSVISLHISHATIQKTQTRRCSMLNANFFPITNNLFCYIVSLESAQILQKTINKKQVSSKFPFSFTTIIFLFNSFFHWVIILSSFLSHLSSFANIFHIIFNLNIVLILQCRFFCC